MKTLFALLVLIAVLTGCEEVLPVEMEQDPEPVMYTLEVWNFASFDVYLWVDTQDISIPPECRIPYGWFRVIEVEAGRHTFYVRNYLLDSWYIYYEGEVTQDDFLFIYE